MCIHNKTSNTKNWEDMTDFELMNNYYGLYDYNKPSRCKLRILAAIGGTVLSVIVALLAVGYAHNRAADR